MQSSSHCESRGSHHFRRTQAWGTGEAPGRWRGGALTSVVPPLCGASSVVLQQKYPLWVPCRWPSAGKPVSLPGPHGRPRHGTAPGSPATGVLGASPPKCSATAPFPGAMESIGRELKGQDAPCVQEAGREQQGGQASETGWVPLGFADLVLGFVSFHGSNSKKSRRPGPHLARQLVQRAPVTFCSGRGDGEDKGGGWRPPSLRTPTPR